MDGTEAVRAGEDGGSRQERRRDRERKSEWGKGEGYRIERKETRMDTSRLSQSRYKK